MSYGDCKVKILEGGNALNITQLNAQLQRLPTSWLVQLAQQYGINITVEQMNSIKQQLRQNITEKSTINDVTSILTTVVDRQTTKKIMSLLQNFQ